MNCNGPLILLYHRVTTLDTDPQLLAVTPENFVAQIELLQRIARPMPLADMVQAAGAGEDLRGAVAITFDDGYADNLLQAKPILRRHKVPATVFVATAGIDSTAEFFWDELDRIFLQPGELPPRLDLRIGTTVYHADLAPYADEQAREFRSWNVTLKQDPTVRHRVYRELCALLHNAAIQQRHEALRQIREWADSGVHARDSHRMMTAAQLRELTDDNLIHIGAHTVNHPLLCVESIEIQREEIEISKATLEKILGRPVRSFSYPFGGRRDYTAQTVAAVRQAGFDYACSNFNGRIDQSTDPFQLPRFIVRDWSAPEFAAHLARYFQRINADTDPRSRAAAQNPAA
jgi:peptidoglycan/xylan/chitin deacetylase (PgdA/CDA1 family)